MQPLEMLLAASTMQGQYAQAWGEALGFVLPVGDQAGRHDDHGGPVQAPGVLFG
ncbi:hypothetical protein D3C80_816170 [compost metagenome]